MQVPFEPNVHAAHHPGISVASRHAVVLQVPVRFVKYILPKGFIAVDGISLTVGEVGLDSFTVYLIPETLRVTTLGRRGKGDAVNIEIEAQTQVLLLCLALHCHAVSFPSVQVAMTMHPTPDNIDRQINACCNRQV